VSAGLDLAALRRAVEEAVEAGVQPRAIVLNPATEVHVADPSLGLPPLRADEMDALDALPVEVDPLVPRGAVQLRER
jgi:hypothetical protein